MLKTPFRFVCLVLLAAVLAGCAGSPKPEESTEPPPIRVGVIKALGTISPYIACQLGYFEDAGLQVGLVDFPDGPTMMEAFASGHIDLTYGGIAPSAIWCSQGVRRKVVGATNSGGHLILAREGGGIEHLSDLKNRTLAAPKTGSVTDTMLRGLVLKRLTGLEPDKDVRLVIGMAPADMPAALLLTKEVEAVVTWEPFAAECIEGYENVRVLFNFNDYWMEQYGRSYPVNVISASQSFIDNRTEELKSFLAAHRRTQRFILEDQAEADRLIGAECQLPPDTVKRARPNLDFTWEVNVDDCMTILGYAQELGYIERVPTAEQLFDLRFQSDD